MAVPGTFLGIPLNFSYIQDEEQDPGSKEAKAPVGGISIIDDYVEEGLEEEASAQLSGAIIFTDDYLEEDPVGPTVVITSVAERQPQDEEPSVQLSEAINITDGYVKETSFPSQAERQTEALRKSRLHFLKSLPGGEHHLRAHPELESASASTVQVALKSFIQKHHADTTKLSFKEKLRNHPQLPPEIGEFPKLQELDLSSNHLTMLPEEIGRLGRLQVLDLSVNRLNQGLPSTFKNLSELKVLALSCNRLKEVPKEVEGLRSLRELNLMVNNLTQLSPQIRSIPKLNTLGNNL